MCEGVLADGLRACALAFQDGVRSIWLTKVCKPAAEKAHHHRLDHAQGEECSYSCIHRIATGAQHF
jgi:hypothetical protein